MDKTLKIKISVNKETGAIKVVDGEFKELDASVKKADKSSESFTKRLTDMAHLGAGIYALKQAFDVATGSLSTLVETASTFETQKSILKTLEGDAIAAEKSFEWIKEFTSETPYEMEAVGEAFLKAKAYGIDPTTGTLETLGDTASGMGKDLMQAVEAMSDAMTGENERLKEFGVKANVIGDQVAYNWTSNSGKAKHIVIQNNSEMIQSTLEALFNSKYDDAMQDQMSTWNGIKSNFSDNYTNIVSDVANSSGVFNAVKLTVKDLSTEFKSVTDNKENMEAMGAVARGSLIMMAKGFEAISNVVIGGLFVFETVDMIIDQLVNNAKYGFYGMQEAWTEMIYEIQLSGNNVLPDFLKDKLGFSDEDLKQSKIELNQIRQTMSEIEINAGERKVEHYEYVDGLNLVTDTISKTVENLENYTVTLDENTDAKKKNKESEFGKDGSYSKDISKELETSSASWINYYETIGDFESAWLIKSASLSDEYIDLKEDEYKKIYAAFKKEYFDKIKKGSKEANKFVVASDAWMDIDLNHKFSRYEDEEVDDKPEFEMNFGEIAANGMTDAVMIGIVDGFNDESVAGLFNSIGSGLASQGIQAGMNGVIPAMGLTGLAGAGASAGLGLGMMAVGSYFDKKAKRRAEAKARKAEQESLELRLLKTTGSDLEILNAEREKELKATNATNRALLESIYAAEDAKIILEEKTDLESRMLQLTGDDLALLNITRYEERKEVDASNRVLLESIYLEEDRQEAVELYMKSVSKQLAYEQFLYSTQEELAELTQSNTTNINNIIYDLIDGLDELADSAKDVVTDLRLLGESDRDKALEYTRQFNLKNSELKSYFDDDGALIPDRYDDAKSAYDEMTSLSERITSSDALIGDELKGIGDSLADELSLAADMFDFTKEVLQVNIVEMNGGVASALTLSEDQLASYGDAVADGVFSADEVAAMSFTDEQKQAIEDTATNTTDNATTKSNLAIETWVKQLTQNLEDEILKDTESLSIDSFGYAASLGTQESLELARLLGTQDYADFYSKMQSFDVLDAEGDASLLKTMLSNSTYAGYMSNLDSAGLLSEDVYAANNLLGTQYDADMDKIDALSADISKLKTNEKSRLETEIANISDITTTSSTSKGMTTITAQYTDADGNIINESDTRLYLGKNIADKKAQVTASLKEALKDTRDEELEDLNTAISNIGTLASVTSLETKKTALTDDWSNYTALDGSHADGLDFVPYDGYIAELHYGEGILTADENSLRLNSSPSFSVPAVNNNISNELLQQILKALVASKASNEKIMQILKDAQDGIFPLTMETA